MEKDMRKSALSRTFGFLTIIWVIFLINSLVFHGSLNNFGVIPRTGIGMVGIVTMPFLHGTFAHIISNSISLFIFLWLLNSSFSERHVTRIIVEISILGGLLLWIFGRGSFIHIGASLLVYGLIVYSLIAGIRHKKPDLFIASIVIFVLSGWNFIEGMLPQHLTVSWDGHIAGAMGGFLVGIWEEVTSLGKSKNKEEEQLD